MKYGFASVMLLVTLMAPLLTGCGKTAGETIDDGTITTRVKTSLLNDPEVASTSTRSRAS
jgi:hypothetical protein